MTDLKKKSLSLLIDVWQNGDYSKLPSICHPHVVRHHDRHGAAGIDQFQHAIEYYRAAFSDLKYEVISVIAEGNTVATLYTTTGTHTGPLGSIPPTGIRETIQSIDVFRFKDGLVSDVYMSFDELGMLIRLGAFKA